jgi:hypothetical protein
MPQFPRIVGRFRRLLAPPGRPAEALGVPATGEDLEAELTPLLLELDAVGGEAARIEADAAAEAERRRERGAREAAAILEDARGRADVERARAASAGKDGTREDNQEARRLARSEAARVRRGMEDRLSGPVAEVVECVRRGGR